MTAAEHDEPKPSYHAGAPDWLRRAVIYQVLIDRFARAGGWGRLGERPREEQPVFCGGNLQGVAEKLGYLSDLGINTIWMSPFNLTTAYHGYHITDFLKVEPRFGGGRALGKLVNASEAHGIRLIMDFVPNHVHETHPFFMEARRNKRSRYRDWFYWRKSGAYRTYLSVRELPKLNLEHPDARAHVIGAANHWLDQGISGLRLDHALGPSMGFWQEFRRAIKSRRPETALIGEVAFWGIERRDLATLQLPGKRFYFAAHELGFDVLDATMREYARVFDGLLDFHFQRVMKRLVANTRERLPQRAIQRMLDEHYASYPDGCCLLSFLDNHDMNRFLFEAGGDRRRLLRAAKIQFAQRSTPVIYYGTEAGMGQSAAISGDHGDLQARRLMRWQAGQGHLWHTYRRLIRKWKQPGTAHGSVFISGAGAKQWT
jgi:cyclomaltodextrinase